MTFGAEHAVKSVKDELLMRRMDKVRLGMSFKEIENILKKPFNRKKLDRYEYYFVDGQHVRLAMYFKNDRLDSFVRGWHYTTQHQNKKEGLKKKND